MYTLAQMLNFKKYLAVQKSGRYNMFDPRARQATGLSREEYIFNIENYDALAKAYKEFENESSEYWDT